MLDENQAAGGRIWQALEARGAADPDEQAGLALIRAFAASGTEVQYDASVWGIEPDGTVSWTSGGVARSVRAARIILATGTTERPMPIPGWTLPGVMTVGAAQIGLKTGGLVPGGDVWIAGQGPLTLLYAAQAIRAGGKLAGILDLSDPKARWRALRYLPAAIADIRKGLGWLWELRRAGVPILCATDVRAEGNGTLQRVSFRADGRARTEAADTLLLHDGVIPSIQITRALGCDHVWDQGQRCWRPRTDDWGETSHSRRGCRRRWRRHRRCLRRGGCRARSRRLAARARSAASTPRRVTATPRRFAPVMPPRWHRVRSSTRCSRRSPFVRTTRC